MKTILIFLIIVSSILLQGCNNYNEIILKDDFSKLDTGLFSAPVGPHTEYHYLPEAGIKGNWAVSSFSSGTGWGTAWQVKKVGSVNVMSQTFINKSNKTTHPMIVAGDSLWQNYKLTVRFQSENYSRYSGVAFRYKNDRCFYFFGIRDSMVYLSVFNHAEDFNSLNEKILSEKKFLFKPGEELTAVITLNGSYIKAEMNNVVSLNAEDNTYSKGRIGLVSNVRSNFKKVEVAVSKKDKEAVAFQKTLYEQEASRLQLLNPLMTVWKKITTAGFGVGRNLRFGDLNNDKMTDVSDRTGSASQLAFRQSQ